MPELTCPTCQERLHGPLSQWPYFPFCSHRCKLIDLGRWLDGRNNLPVMEPEAELPPDLKDSPESEE